MEILTDVYLKEYKIINSGEIRNNFSKLNSDTDENNFEYYINSSAVYSSMIEGNSVDLNSYMNSKRFSEKAKSKEIKEIEDLAETYNFAKQNTLTEENLLQSHSILSKKLLIKSKRGKYREEKIGVFDTGGLVYLAVEPECVKTEMKNLFLDIEKLRDRKLNQEEIFYYASLIHLKFVHIHPFMDGNGRAARLLEKWFLSEAAGEISWKIKSEYYYFENRKDYYKNLNLGPDYYNLNYSNCLSFLNMLPKSIY